MTDPLPVERPTGTARGTIGASRSARGRGKQRPYERTRRAVSTHRALRRFRRSLTLGRLRDEPEDAPAEAFDRAGELVERRGVQIEEAGSGDGLAGGGDVGEAPLGE